MAMVTKKDRPEDLINKIHEWISRQPNDILTLSQEETPYEFIVKISPINQRSSPIEFRIAKNSTNFTVSLGRGIQFEDIPRSESVIVDICDAVANGKVIESMWDYNGRLVKSKGVIDLKNNYWYSNRTKLLRWVFGYLFRKIQKRKIVYEPFWEK